MSILDRVLRAGEGKKVKALEGLVPEINALEVSVAALSDDALRGKTDEFRQRIANGESLDDLLVESFAVMREAGKRVLGQRHYDVQLMGGAALHFGWISEMKTGEGKTLVSTLPAYLNGLSGNGVHLVTVNDYLARRDSEWMGRVHRWLGLSVGLVVPGHRESPQQKREDYAADITYGTNNEFGFDYLRDNMAGSLEEKVQRGHNFAIVDEVDSILIDEARTPLIISGRLADAAQLYYRFASVVRALSRDVWHHDDGRLAAQFERDALHRVGGILVDELANFGRSGEGDLIDIGVLDHAVASGVTVAGDDVEHTSREASFSNEISQTQRGERRLLGRLQHNGATRSKSWRNLEARHQQREVPGNDLRTNANWLLDRVAEHGTCGHSVGSGRFATNLRGPACHETDLANRTGNVDSTGHALWLAIVDRFQFSKLVRMGFQKIGQSVHRAIANHRGKVGPAAIVKSSTSCGNSAVHILIRRVNDSADFLSTGRIFDRDCRVMRRCNPFIVNEKGGLAGKGFLGGFRIGALLARNRGHLVHRNSPHPMGE